MPRYKDWHVPRNVPKKYGDLRILRAELVLLAQVGALQVKDMEDVVLGRAEVVALDSCHHHVSVMMAEE